MVHIKKTKTFGGELMYAVVENFKSETKDENNNIIVTEQELPVDFKHGKEIVPAVFPLTEEGLQMAKEIQKLFKK